MADGLLNTLRVDSAPIGREENRAGWQTDNGILASSNLILLTSKPKYFNSLKCEWLFIIIPIYLELNLPEMFYTVYFFTLAHILTFYCPKIRSFLQKKKKKNASQIPFYACVRASSYKMKFTKVTKVRIYYIYLWLLSWRLIQNCSMKSWKFLICYNF